MKIYLTVLVSFFIVNSFAQNITINQFNVQENRLKKSRLNIIAVDSLQMPISQISGNYTFSVNGFTQVLSFENGVATLNLPIEQSSFVYIKHRNEKGVYGKLIYVRVKNQQMSLYEISAFWLILIPTVLLVLCFMYRKFIVVAIILFIVYMYISNYSGLSTHTYFESIVDKLQHISTLIH